MASPIVKDFGIHRNTANRITKNRHIHTDTRMISISEMSQKNKIKPLLIRYRAERPNLYTVLGLPYKMDGGVYGKYLNRTSMRYQGVPRNFFHPLALRGINSKATHYLLSILFSSITF